MGETGHNWGSWAFVQLASSDWDEDTVADAGTQTSDPITIDTVSACSIGIQLEATGTITGSVTISIWGHSGTSYQKATDSVFSFNVDLTTAVKWDDQIKIDVGLYNIFKISILNNSGETLTSSVNIKTATVPVAS